MNFLFKKRYDKVAVNLTEQQKSCVHDWRQMAESEYSRCVHCGLMRHDKDGDLINPFVYEKLFE